MVAKKEVGGPVTWAPPRGPRPRGRQDPWAPLAARDLSLLPARERIAVLAHKAVLGEMFRNRHREGWSLRQWAEKAALAPSVVAATEAGSSWPGFRQIHAMADCLDLTLTLKAPAPLSSSTAKWVPHPPITTAELTIRTAAAQAGDSALRGRLAHDLICWQLAYARRALGVTIADLNRKGGISANTVTRVEHAPQTGEVVSYRVMLAMAYEVRMELLATWRHGTPRLVWQG